MSAYLLDVPELHRRLDARRRERGLTWRQIARITTIRLTGSYL